MYCAHEFLHGAPYAVCVELKHFYLFVFGFGGLLFVLCVTVCGCGVAMWRAGKGAVWRRMEVCVMGIYGESRDV